MEIRLNIWPLCFAGFLAGCATPPEPVEPVVDRSAVMTILGHDVRPENILFPEYLLMQDFELGEHGRIPATSLVGAGMSSALDLNTVRRRYIDLLASEGWHTDKMEIGRQSFRLMASLEGATVEIRAVQGEGPVQVFLLYRPGMETKRQSREQAP